MLEPFLRRLEGSVVVCDGAMGTQLYSKGIFLNRCFDELNLTHPSLVREVHQEYVSAGAEILETNTFGANRIKLEPHGLAGKVREINSVGVRIAREVAGDRAYVCGSVGPLGIRIEPYGKLSETEARALFAEQIAVLAECGADLICLETFSDRNEIRVALAAAKAVSALPVVAQLTLQDDGNSLDGAPPETFGPELEGWGADVVGANCGVGPQVMLECVERLAGAVSAKIAAQPNAGKPRSYEGRNIYLSSPEYMASYARRFLKAGARIVGGCCGTTPAHIRAIVAAVAETHPRESARRPSRPARAVVPASPSPAVEESRFSRMLAGSDPIWTVEVLPPVGVDPGEMMEALWPLRDAGVCAIRVTEAPRGSARMGALAFAALIERHTGLETILHCSCNDRSLHAMQSELFGAAALGLRNLLLSDGEPLRLGDYLDATTVLDVDSLGLTRLVDCLNTGRDPGGRLVGRPTSFCPGVLVNPSSLDPADEVRRLEQKIGAGARFAVTEPVFRPDALERFVRAVESYRIPIIAQIRPLVSFQEAEFFDNEVPGMSVSEDHKKRMLLAKSPEKEREEGLRIAREVLVQVKGMVRGIEVSSAGALPSSALEIWSSAGLAGR